MTTPYEKTFEELSAYLDSFCHALSQHKEVDFSAVVERVSTFLDSIDENNLTYDDHQYVQKLSKQLTLLSQNASQELMRLRDEIATSVKRKQGLNAYALNTTGK